mmetsp:Transcript_90211/g.170091  ORF Transcript_90211/g.170091 Transcript_90211/m.170091 type:complete len:105 (+) Transcript_90211:73-387(+)
MARISLQLALFALLAPQMVFASTLSEPAVSATPDLDLGSENEGLSEAADTQDSMLFQTTAEIKPSGKMTVLYKGRKKIHEPDCSGSDDADMDPHCLALEHVSLR